MAFSIVIDGHNFINDLGRNGKDDQYILEYLSLPVLYGVIQKKLGSEGLYSHPYIRTEFICSDKGQIGSLKSEKRNSFIKKLKGEKGVTVIEVPQETKKQKGVDFTVFIRMMTLIKSPSPENKPYHIVLFASDTDYIPAIRLLAEQGTHVVIVGYKNGDHPLKEGLINESYLSLDLNELLEEMENTIDNNATPPDSE